MSLCLACATRTGTHLSAHALVRVAGGPCREPMDTRYRFGCRDPLQGRCLCSCPASCVNGACLHAEQPGNPRGKSHLLKRLG